MDILNIQGDELKLLNNWLSEKYGEDFSYIIIFYEQEFYYFIYVQKRLLVVGVFTSLLSQSPIFKDDGLGIYFVETDLQYTILQVNLIPLGGAVYAWHHNGMSNSLDEAEISFKLPKNNLGEFSMHMPVYRWSMRGIGFLSYDLTTNNCIYQTLLSNPYIDTSDHYIGIQVQSKVIRILEMSWAFEASDHDAMYTEWVKNNTMTLDITNTEPDISQPRLFGYYEGRGFLKQFSKINTLEIYKHSSFSTDE